MAERLAILLVFFLAVCGGFARAAVAQDTPAAPAWLPPSPADGAAFTVHAGAELDVPLSAGTSVPIDVVRIASAAALPTGARLTGQDGNPASALLSWTPAARQVGDYTFAFGAQTTADPPVAAPPLTIVVHVLPPATPTPVALTGPGDLSRWAYVRRTVPARSRPGGKGRIVGWTSVLTPEYEQNLVSLVSSLTETDGRQWIKVKLAILPLGASGWVPRSALGTFHDLRTHLVVNRSLLRATLYRGGFPIFRTGVGIGKVGTATPAGQFYVRELLINHENPFYGPLLFGTSARSPFLTDWPGGGYIGIHGTSLPDILPGRVSHGCIRMKNPAILRLARLMPLGTPLTIV